MLLEELWRCVETSNQTQEKQFLTGNHSSFACKNLTFCKAIIIKYPIIILIKIRHVSLTGEEATLMKRIPSQPQLNGPSERQIFHPSLGKASPEAQLQSLKHSMPKTPPRVSRPKESPQKLKKQNNVQQFNTQSRKRKISSDVLEQVDTLTDDSNTSLANEMSCGGLLHGDYCMDLLALKEWFKPLPPVLSPVHSPSSELVSEHLPFNYFVI